MKREGLKHLVVVGSGGSNQIVATTVHVNALNSKPSVSASWIAKDPSNLDNSMNMLSSLSFSSLQADASNTWAHPIKMLRQIASALYSSNGMVLPMGTSCISLDPRRIANEKPKPHTPQVETLQRA